MAGCAGKKAPQTAESLAQRLVENAIEPRVSGDGQTVVFTRFSKGKEFLSEVMALNYEEIAPRPVTDNGWADGQPTISADGNLVVFVSEREGLRNLWAYDRMSTRYYAITETGGQQPDLHPEFPVVLYVTSPGEDRQRDIKAIDLTTGQVRLIIGTDADESQPRWSPDGRRIAYVSDRNGTDDLYIHDSQTKRNYQVTTLPSDERYPEWSPDQNLIVFSSNFDPFTGKAEAGTQYAGPRIHLWRVDVRNLVMPSSPKLLFQNNLEGAQALHPAFHPNGEELLFSTNGSGLGVWQVVSLNFRKLLQMQETATLNPVGN